MAEKAWKRAERAIADHLGGQRIPITGRAGPDVVSDWLAVEVKTRKALPKWLVEAVAQAVSGADGRLPIVVLHALGQRYSDALVIMRLADFEDWYGALEARDER